MLTTLEPQALDTTPTPSEASPEALKQAVNSAFQSPRTNVGSLLPQDLLHPITHDHMEAAGIKLSSVITLYLTDPQHRMHPIYPRLQFIIHPQAKMELLPVVWWVNTMLSGKFEGSNAVRRQVGTWWMTPNAEIRLDPFDETFCTPLWCLGQLQHQLGTTQRQIIDPDFTLRNAASKLVV